MSSVPQQQHCSFIASHQYIFLLTGAWDWTYMWLKAPKTSNFLTCNKIKTSLETGRLIQSESDLNSRHRKDFSNLKKKKWFENYEKSLSHRSLHFDTTAGGLRFEVLELLTTKCCCTSAGPQRGNLSRRLSVTFSANDQVQGVPFDVRASRKD